MNWAGSKKVNQSKRRLRTKDGDIFLREPITLKNTTIVLDQKLKPNKVAKVVDFSGNEVIFLIGWLVLFLTFEWFSTVLVWLSENEFSS